MKAMVLAGIVGLVAAPVAAQEVVTYPFEGTFGDATFAVESAIIDRGW